MKYLLSLHTNLYLVCENKQGTIVKRTIDHTHIQLRLASLFSFPIKNNKKQQGLMKFN